MDTFTEALFGEETVMFMQSVSNVWNNAII